MGLECIGTGLDLHWIVIARCVFSNTILTQHVKQILCFWAMPKLTWKQDDYVEVLDVE